MEYHYYWNDITRSVGFFSNEDLTVLEVGCGNGRLIGKISGRKRVGIDSDPDQIRKAEAAFPDVGFYCMKADSISLDETFDLIILSNLVGYLEDVQSVLSGLHRVCHSRTRIIVTCYSFLWEPVLKAAEMIGLKKKTPQQNWLSGNDIRNLLYLSGFETYRNSSGMLFPIYLPVISPFLNSVVAKLPLFRSLCVNNYTFARRQKQLINAVEQEPSVSVIVPVRNESGNIPNAIRRIPAMGHSTEIIFVEGGSSDGTWEVIQQCLNDVKSVNSVKAFRQIGKGKKDAVQLGFSKASGDILIILDGDLTVDPEELPLFYRALTEGKGEFVNGCRLVYQMEKQAMRLLNLFGNKMFSLIFSWLLDQPVKDTLCGTKALWKTDYERLNHNRSYFGNADPFGDFDLLFGAFKLNLKITELPVHYRRRTYGSSNISRFSHGWLLLKMCWIGAVKIKFAR